MLKNIFYQYERIIVSHPYFIIGFFILLIAFAGIWVGNFRLDASSETLLLENDPTLKEYREVSKHFVASDDFLFVTYTPKKDLYTEESLNEFHKLYDELNDQELISSSNSIFNVPLLHSENLTLDTVDSEILTIDNDEVNPQTAKKALLSNPIYPDLLVSRDGTTTAIQLFIKTDENFSNIVEQRLELKNALISDPDNSELINKLSEIEKEYLIESNNNKQQRDALIDNTRRIIQKYRDNAQVYLGGVPMIASDMIAYIKNDISVFGIGVLIFLLLTLGIIFRQWRWVVAPMLCCACTVWLIIAYLGLSQWPVTVISSNFIALLLIMTLSLIIHIIVRYREHQRVHPQASSNEHLRLTVRAMFRPCFFMMITTIVAFASFTLSGIKPVKDFGWMMTIGLVVAFCIAFMLFPALARLLPPPPLTKHNTTNTGITVFLGKAAQYFTKATVLVSLCIAIISIIGISKLSVENSFISYFKSSTEIHQGMLVIDEKLGGTTSLDIIIIDDTANNQVETEPCDPFIDDTCDEESAQPDTWFTYSKLQKIRQIHNYLENHPAIGKVLSLATTLDIVKLVNGGKDLDDFQLPLLPRFIPEYLKNQLIYPYFSEDTKQIRFGIRILDSQPDLHRDNLLKEIHQHITNEIGIQEENFIMTGLMVMYNNILQSLFDSQIKTLGVVFIAIMLAFMFLFKSWRIALVGIAPNVLAASALLGLMGWLGIPLDLMTITVAAITVGIAVDDTIHYIHRFNEEIVKDWDYIAAVTRCNGSIGIAMLYTSVTIMAGFSILTLSNFIPSIYFGVFTAFAMFVALVAALTLLPALMIIFKPYGKGK